MDDEMMQIIKQIAERVGNISVFYKNDPERFAAAFEKLIPYHQDIIFIVINGQNVLEAAQDIVKGVKDYVNTLEQSSTPSERPHEETIITKENLILALQIISTVLQMFNTLLVL